MARNNLLSAVGAVGAIINSPEAKKIVSEADVIKSETRNKGGRKPKPKEEKAQNANRFYLDDAQQEKLNEYIGNTGIPVSVLVKQLLIEKGIL